MGVRADSANHDAPALVLHDLLGFRREPSDDGDEWTIFGDSGVHVHWTLDPARRERGIPGAGTVHHIAWACHDEEHEDWRQRLADAGAQITPVVDRDYFHAIYFREPGGVLFEIATEGPGFDVDEDPAHLGEQLRLPAQHEGLREQLSGLLVPVVNPRTGQPISFDAP
jgi:glyoxalase family protein